jgi:hypothetical protein
MAVTVPRQPFVLFSRNPAWSWRLTIAETSTALARLCYAFGSHTCVGLQSNVRGAVAVSRANLLEDDARAEALESERTTGGGAGVVEQQPPGGGGLSGPAFRGFEGKTIKIMLAKGGRDEVSEMSELAVALGLQGVFVVTTVGLYAAE